VDSLDAKYSPRQGQQIHRLLSGASRFAQRVRAILHCPVKTGRKRMHALTAIVAVMPLIAAGDKFRG